MASMDVQTRRPERLLAAAAPAGTLVLAAAAMGLVITVDPNESGHYPTCPFLWATGLYCPGCGSMRVIHALGHGHLGQALGLNLLTVACLPVIGWLWWRWASERVGLRPPAKPIPAPLIWALLVVIVAFTVLRNTPAGAALAP